MNAIKVKKYLSLFIVLVIIGLVTYKFIFYTPFLLDQQDRNVIDKSIDFISFGWHLTKGSIYREYMKDIEKAQKEFGRAALYREIYLKKRFNLDDNNLQSILDLYKKLDLHSTLEIIYTEMLKEEGNGLSFYREAGKTFMLRKNWKKAVDAYNKVINDDQINEMDFYYLGLSYWNLKRYEKAKSCFEKTIELKSDFADAYYRLGFIAEKEKNWEKAQDFYEKTLNTLPNHLESLIALKNINKNLK